MELVRERLDRRSRMRTLYHLAKLHLFHQEELPSPAHDEDIINRQVGPPFGRHCEQTVPVIWFGIAHEISRPVRKGVGVGEVLHFVGLHGCAFEVHADDLGIADAGTDEAAVHRQWRDLGVWMTKMEEQAEFEICPC